MNERMKATLYLFRLLLFYFHILVTIRFFRVDSYLTLRLSVHSVIFPSPLDSNIESKMYWSKLHHESKVFTCTPI